MPHRPGVPASLAAWPGDLGCVFCNLIASIDFAIANGMSAEQAEAAGGLILRGRHCFICLNAFPYTSGHVMVMPYAHLDRLAALPTEAAHELIDLAQRTEQALERLYRPHGLNFGMNLGQAAGAGVAGHLHLHATAALERRHQLHDHRGRDAHPAGRPGNNLEADARGVCGTEGLPGRCASISASTKWQRVRARL